MKFAFRKIEYDHFKETSVERFPNKAIYTTEDWYKFLVRYAHIKPVIIEISGG